MLILQEGSTVGGSDMKRKLSKILSSNLRVTAVSALTSVDESWQCSALCLGEEAAPGTGVSEQGMKTKLVLIFESLVLSILLPRLEEFCSCHLLPAGRFPE